MINDKNIGKTIISATDTKSLFSQNVTFYDKWEVFRFVINNPEESNSCNVELRKYRIKDNGSKEYCDERVQFKIDGSDLEVAAAINSLVVSAIQKGVDLNYFRH